jgi:multidrug transporter EmrE-like cation transporter
MDRSLILALIVLDGLLVAVGQLFIKSGMLRIGQAADSPFSNIGGTILAMCRSPYVWVGLGISVICFVLWALILTKAPLMLAGPLMNATFYLVLVAMSVWLLGERLTITKVAGIAMLLVAITLLSRERM